MLHMDLARKISQAWRQGKDASGARALEENGEIALSEGNKLLARRYFEAAERELGQLHPTPVGVPSTQEGPASMLAPED